MLAEAYAILKKHYQTGLAAIKNPDEQEWCELKVNHSQDVLAQGQRIIATESAFQHLTPLQHEYLEGNLLLHDIGRFYDDVIRNGNYNFGHGEYAVKLLLDETDPYWHDPLLLLPIRYHDQIDIRGLFQDRDYLRANADTQDLLVNFAKLLRDADKLSNLLRDAHGHFYCLPRYSDTPEATPAVLQAFLQGEAIVNGTCVTKIDCVLRSLAWLNDLNFVSSSQILLQEHMPEGFMEILRQFGANETLITPISKAVDTILHNNLAK